MTVNLYMNTSADGHPEQYVIASKTYTGIPAQTIGFIVCGFQNPGDTVPIQWFTTDEGIINNITITRVFTVFQGNSGPHWVNWDETGKAAIDKVIQRLLKAEGTTREYGLTLSTVGERDVPNPGDGARIRIEEGAIWRGTVRLFCEVCNPPDTDPGGSGEFDYYIRNPATPGGWDESHPSQYNNLYYDDGTGTPHELTAGRYAVNWVYRLVQDNANALGVVIGQGDYTLAEAQGSQPPDPLPAHITAFGYLVGRIIVLKGATLPTLVENTSDIRFTGTTTTDHGSLTGVLGGGQYHLPQSVRLAANGAGGPPTDTNRFMTQDVTYNKAETRDLVSRRQGGLVADPTWTDHGDGTITVNALQAVLFDNPNLIGFPDLYTLPAVTYNSLTDNAVSYIVGDYNGGSPIQRALDASDLPLINESNVIPVITLWRSGTTLTLLPWDDIGQGLANKLHLRFVKTQRFELQSGLNLTESAPRVLTVSEGTVWYGAQSITMPSCTMGSLVPDPTLGILVTNLWWHSAPNVWTKSIVTQYDNTHYDDNTGGMKTVSDGNYVVVWVYRGLSVNQNRIELVLGQGDYNLAQAQDSQPPVDLPGAISTVCILVGRVIIKKNDPTATLVQSAFATALPNASVIKHNDSMDIQGGATGDYQHLTTEQLNRVPTADVSAALTGTFGSPSGANKFVTDTDPRMTDARPASGGDADTLDGHPSSYFQAVGDLPTLHASTHQIGGTDHPEPVDMGSMHLHGWPQDTNGNYLVNLDYDPSTRKVTLTPTGASFDIYVKGKKFTFTGTYESDAHPNTTGPHYFYLNDAGTPTWGTSFWPLAEVSPVCAVYYNADIMDGIGFFELHTWQRNPSMHARLHMIDGTQVQSGFDIGDILINTDTAAAKRWTLTQGTVYDEDISMVLGPKAAASYTVLYRFGAAGNWRWTRSMTDPYKVGANYIQYNSFSGGSWDLSEIGDGRYVNYYLFVLTTMDPDLNFVVVPGQRIYDSIGEAELETVGSIDWGTEMPFQEIAPIYKLTYKTSSLYTSPGKCVLITNPLRLSGSKASLSADAAPAAPIPHSESHVNGTDDLPVAAGLQILGGYVRPVYGSGAQTITEGNDPRLSDPRTPIGAAGGDLGDSYPNPSVTGIRGTSVPSPTVGYLQYTGSAFAWTTPGPTAIQFSQTASVTVVNSTTETVLNGAGQGSVTIEAGTLVAGKTIRISAGGTYTRTSGTITIRIRLGGVTGTVVMNTAAITPGASGSWHLPPTNITFRTVGVGGTCIGHGYLMYFGATGGPAFNMTSAGVVSRNTTVPFDVALTAQHSNAAAGNSITCTNLIIEVI